jgi:hypothetical protein
MAERWWLCCGEIAFSSCQGDNTVRRTVYLYVRYINEELYNKYNEEDQVKEEEIGMTRSTNWGGGGGEMRIGYC